MIQKVKGTQDFIDLTLFNFVINQTKKHLEEYNFTQIETPIIEYTKLFQRALGEFTDVVSKEMFIIDKKDESICLRPEATASIVRAFVENNIAQNFPLPWKIFTYGPMFRYERPQKGRYRQFHQISMEVIGSDSILQDAEFIKMLDRLFKDKLFLNNYAILINFLGCYADRHKFQDIVKNFLETVSDKICDTCKERKDKNPLRIFDCKNPACKDVYINAPRTADHLCANCQTEWKQLQDALELISVSFSYAPTLVRGLDYYDKTVFEFVSQNLGAQNAFCGGGRYDKLVKDISDKQDAPALGAAIGIERVVLLLEEIKDKLPLPMQKPLNVIIPFSEKQRLLALLVANELHKHNIVTDVLLEDASIKSLMRKANKMGAKYALILGEEEQQKREVTVKNMITGEEQKVPQAKIAEFLLKS